jgi:hypothetical protein
VGWAAEPLGTTGEAVVAVVACVCVVAGLFRLVAQRAVQSGSGRSEEVIFPGLLVSLEHWAREVLLRSGWETGAAVAAVVLETLLPSRPWHTGLLGLAIFCYLFAVHQAESASPAGALRDQAPVLVTSVSLLALATGIAMVPSAASGAVSGWLEIIAALAAMIAGGLALPIGPGRSHTPP